jgi:hypothetical protein
MSQQANAEPPAVGRRSRGGWAYYRFPRASEEDAFRGIVRMAKLPFLLLAAGLCVFEGGLGWCFTGGFLPLSVQGLMALALFVYLMRLDSAHQVILGPGWIGFRVGGLIRVTRWRRLQEVERLELRPNVDDPWDDFGEAGMSLSVVMRKGRQMEIDWFGDWRGLRDLAEHLSAEFPHHGGTGVPVKDIECGPHAFDPWPPSDA